MTRKALHFHKDVNINKGESQIVFRDLKALEKLYLIKPVPPMCSKYSLRHTG